MSNGHLGITSNAISSVSLDLNKETFVALLGQTEFVLTTSPNNVDMFINGVLVVDENSYALNEDTVTTTKQLFAGDVVVLRKY